MWVLPSPLGQELPLFPSTVDDWGLAQTYLMGDILVQLSHLLEVETGPGQGVACRSPQVSGAQSPEA